MGLDKHRKGKSKFTVSVKNKNQTSKKIQICKMQLDIRYQILKLMAGGWKLSKDNLVGHLWYQYFYSLRGIESILFVKCVNKV